MSFRIVPLKKGTVPVIALYRPVLLIGRHPDCDIRLESRKISRRHCCVAMAYDRVLIRDLGSRNGVRVNGKLCEEARLYPGDELAIGPLIFRLEQEAEEPEVAVAGSARPGAPGSRAQPGAKPGNQRAAPIPAGPRPDSESDLVPLDDI
jgi:pSer/pThr/pTyr-binding forkhead associated (FHA) protein